jgi:TolB-like protein
LNESLLRLSKSILAAHAALPEARFRSRVAVLDFEDGFEYARRTRLGFSVSELLASHLIRNAKGLRVVERKQLDKVLSELELRLSGFLTEPEAARLGDLVGADLLLLGSVSEAGEDVVIVTRLVETDTGAALLSESISVPRSVLIPEARKSIQVDNRAAGGYRLTYSDGFWEHEAAVSYQYKFLEGLALGFEVSGGLSSERKLIFDLAGTNFAEIEKRYSILGLSILFEAGPLWAGPVALFLEAGPMVQAYSDRTVLVTYFDGVDFKDTQNTTIASNEVLLGAAASLRAEIPMGLFWRLSSGIHVRFFPDVSIPKSITWTDSVPSTYTVNITDTVHLSGFGAWIGAAYRF